METVRDPVLDCRNLAHRRRHDPLSGPLAGWQPCAGCGSRRLGGKPDGCGGCGLRLRGSDRQLAARGRSRPGAAAGLRGDLPRPGPVGPGDFHVPAQRDRPRPWRRILGLQPPRHRCRRRTGGGSCQLWLFWPVHACAAEGAMVLDRAGGQKRRRSCGPATGRGPNSRPRPPRRKPGHPDVVGDVRGHLCWHCARCGAVRDRRGPPLGQAERRHWQPDPPAPSRRALVRDDRPLHSLRGLLARQELLPDRGSLGLGDVPSRAPAGRHDQLAPGHPQGGRGGL